MKKFSAFTLAEVLIALTIIGVVAALVVPTMIQNYREKILISQLKTAYSTFSQAVYMAKIDNGPIETWDIGEGDDEDSALKLYNILKPYLKIQKECGTGAGCFADHYEALFNENWALQPATYSLYARGILANGVSFWTWTCGTGCGTIAVDVNGKAGPNKAGVDYFYLRLFPTGLEPAGFHYNTIHSNEPNCKYNNTGAANGVSCAWWAIEHGNMDYLRKEGQYTNY